MRRVATSVCCRRLGVCRRDAQCAAVVRHGEVRALARVDVASEAALHMLGDEVVRVAIDVAHRLPVDLEEASVPTRDARAIHHQVAAARSDAMRCVQAASVSVDEEQSRECESARGSATYCGGWNS